MISSTRLLQTLRCLKRAIAGTGFALLAASMMLASLGVHHAWELRQEIESNEVLGEELSAATAGPSCSERRLLRRLVVVRCPAVPPTQSSHAGRPGRLIAVDGHFLANGLRAPLLS